MITSVFLCFVAVGISLGAAVFGYGNVFLLMLATSLTVVLLNAMLLRRRQSAPVRLRD